MATPLADSQVSDQSERDKSITSVEIGQEKTELDPTELEKAPDGGARAWLVAAAGFAIFFCCLGFSNSFGTFEEYYLTHQLRNESSDNIAWIGSLSAFLQFAAGAIGGPLFDRYGAWIIRPAAVAYVFAVMMLSLCNEYWQIILVQGGLMGTVMGFLQFPAFAAVSQYFVKRRAAAMGIVVSGSSVGGIVIPIALSKLLNGTSLGFGFSVRIIGFIMIPLMAFACIAIKARLPSRPTTFWIPSAYKELGFILLILSFFFTLLGVFTPLFFLPTYAVTRGMDPTLAGYLLAILNGASTFGRIITGIMADKYGRLNTFATGSFLSGIAIFCMNAAKTNTELIVYAAFFGLFSGTVVSGASAAFSLYPKDPRDIGTYMGMGISVSAFGALIGPPINGAFYNAYGGFFQVSMFSGAICVFGAGLVFATKATTAKGILGMV